MAIKRAFVHTVLYATAASRVFSEEQLMEQDREIAANETPPRAKAGRWRTSGANSGEAGKIIPPGIWDKLCGVRVANQTNARVEALTGTVLVGELTEAEARDTLLGLEGTDGQQENLI